MTYVDRLKEKEQIVRDLGSAIDRFAKLFTGEDVSEPKGILTKAVVTRVCISENCACTGACRTPITVQEEIDALKSRLKELEGS